MILPLSYETGEIAFCDFTQLNGVEITIAGQACPHLLFHYRLAWSGWSYAQVVQGCESADITRRNHALCSHYGLAYSRNNCGVAHENDRVESPYGHPKRRIEQALLVRGSTELGALAAYQAFLAEVADGYNRPRLIRLEQGKPALQPLPPFRFPNYDIEQLTVRRTSTIEVHKVVYSVQPRLIDQRLTVRICRDRLQLLLGRQLSCELVRLHGGDERHGRAWSIDLEHLINGLRRKPRALLHCRYQRELLPDEGWWEQWQQLRSNGDRDAAARSMVEALQLGCRLAGYKPVLAWLQKAHHRQGMSLAALQKRFRLPPIAPCMPNAFLNTTCRSMTTSLSSVPRPQAAEAALPILLRQLRLAWVRTHWQNPASQAEGEDWSPRQFLDALCEQEVEQRQRARQQRLLRAAHLPWSKALAEYDHGGRIDASRWQELQKARADYNLPAALERLDRYPLLLIDDMARCGGTNRSAACCLK